MDNFCNTRSSLVTGNGYILHNGRFYTHSDNCGNCDTDNPTDSGQESYIRTLTEFKKESPYKTDSKN